MMKHTRILKSMLIIFNLLIEVHALILIFDYYNEWIKLLRTTCYNKKLDQVNMEMCIRLNIKRKVDFLLSKSWTWINSKRLLNLQNSLTTKSIYWQKWVIQTLYVSYRCWGQPTTTISFINSAMEEPLPSF